MSIHSQSYLLPQPWEIAIGDWLTWLTAAGVSPATLRTRRGHIRSVARVLGAPAPAAVGETDLIGILGRPGQSNEHRRGLRASLRSFYRWLLITGQCEDNPAEALPHVVIGPPTAKPATDAIWRGILEAADERTALMARLACEAGLRRAEVAQVHSDDLIDDVDGVALIVHGKGGKQRTLPLTDALGLAITAALPAEGGYLFPGQMDGHLSPQYVGKLVSAVMPPGWSMHKLRHRFATRGYLGTRDIRAVQEALGHASVATTQRYTAVSSAEVRRVSEAAGRSSGYGAAS
jgi:integrase